MLIRCHNCCAIYDCNAAWVRGYSTGTMGNFKPVAEVPEDRCPVCSNKRDMTKDERVSLDNALKNSTRLINGGRLVI